MKQANLIEAGRFEINEVPVPEVGANQVLIEVKSVGICGSDIHAFHGKHPFVHAPIVMGHEACGVVVKLGSEVSKFKPGDRVVLRPQKVCGKCHPCRHGRYNICQSLEVLGCQCTGAYSDYYAADAELFTRIPDALSYDEGAIIEPLAVGVHAVKRGADDVHGKKVLVIGAGTIGNLLAQSAKAMGAAAVMITDVSEQKLELAAQVGIDYPVNVAKASLSEEILSRFGEDGVDVIYECSANANALNQVLDIARKGVNVVVVGVYGGLAPINIAYVQDREYSLIGTLMYVQEDYDDSIRYLEEGKIQTRPLISARYSLDEIQSAYDYINANKDTVQKVLIHP